MNINLDPMPSPRLRLPGRIAALLRPEFIGAEESALGHRGYVEAPCFDADAIWAACSGMPVAARAYLTVVSIACALRPMPDIRETFDLAHLRRTEVLPMLALVTDPALIALGEVLSAVMLARYETLAAIEWMEFALEQEDEGLLTQADITDITLFDDRVEQRCAIARAGLLTAMGGYSAAADPTVAYLLAPAEALAAK